MAVTVRVESPLQDDVRALVRQLNDHLLSLTPPDRIIELAQAEGITRLVLETGDRHPEAWRLYESRGFVRCGPVLDYFDSPWSEFYEKSLAPVAVA